MSKITINPQDVQDLKTPLYRQDEAGNVYRLLPETTADQVDIGGQKLDTKISSIDSNIASAQSMASSAQSTADANTLALADKASKSVASQSSNGLMSAADKTKLDGIAENANNYSLPTATSSVRGGVKTGYSANGKNYPVQLSNEQMFVNVPWTDTTYSAATQSTNGLMSATDKVLFDEAVEHGQLDDIPFLGNKDANTLTETGTYYVSIVTDGAYNVYENHWPSNALSARTKVIVSRSKENSEVLIQQIIHPNQSWIRSKNQADGWTRWIPIYIHSGSTHIYLSKSGSDNNTGLSPDYPVLTVGRALEIAGAVKFTNSTNNHIYFRFGAGDWGNITFANLPHLILISPYDGAIHYEYSEDLPKFTTITLYCIPYCAIYSPIVENLQVMYNSLCLIAEGWKRINYIYVVHNSETRMYGKTGVENIWEIGNTRQSNSAVVICEYFSMFYLTGNTKIRLIENNTANYFLYLSFMDRAFLGKTCEYLLNNFTFSGGKTYMLQGSNLVSDDTIPNIDTMPLVVSKMFGTNHFVHKGASINNFVFTGQW